MSDQSTGDASVSDAAAVAPSSDGGQVDASAVSDAGGDDVQAAGGDAGTTDGVREAAAAAAEEIRIKILGLDGTEKEYTPSEVSKLMSRARDLMRIAGEKNVHTTRQMKGLSGTVERLRDPNTVFDVLRQLGHDTEALAERHLASRLEELSLTPEQRRIRALERDAEVRAAQDKARVEAEEKERSTAMVAAAKERLTAQFSEALGKVGLPADTEFINAMASVIERNRIERQKAADIGLPDDIVPVLSSDEAARLVLKAEQIRANKTMGALKGTDLTARLADKAAGELRVDKSKRKPGDLQPARKLNEAMLGAASRRPVADEDGMMDKYAFRRSIIGGG